MQAFELVPQYKVQSSPIIGAIPFLEPGSVVHI